VPAYEGFRNLGEPAPVSSASSVAHNPVGGGGERQGDIRSGHPVRPPGLARAAVALAAAISLAVGLDANVGIFSLINAFVLRPLPVSDPDSIVALYTSDFSSTSQTCRWRARRLALTESPPISWRRTSMPGATSAGSSGHPDRAIELSRSASPISMDSIDSMDSMDPTARDDQIMRSKIRRYPYRDNPMPR
jgi:hypothetical protein